ncbi:hypothetical protein LAZ67_18000155, partial [Cordylochernes scorpioides]
MDKLKKACDLRSFAKKMEPGKVTRRKILSAAHSLFDPIGFTCPFTIIPKMLLQESYGVKAGWDTDLSEDIGRRFNAWLSQLTEVDKLKIPRCVVQSQDRRTWTLHIFMDSSNAAFAACAYLRSGFPGSVQVQLLMARSRVAPMKNTNIPRLELVACEIGSRLAVHIKSMMEFEDIPITLWTDSTTALACIKRDMNWSVFVAGRVKKIRQNSSITDWRHVPGKENPADIPSRGASISQLITTRWWEGPVWLKKEEQFWTQSFAKKMEPGKVTRRKILSAAHSLFDPIGFTCPFTIIPKMLLQESYGVKAGWDTDLSEDIGRRFNAWLSQLTEVDKLKIPRCVVQSQDRRTWTLHIFMDSSNAAFAACAYLRSGFPGSVQVQLLMARSRVAPMKNTNIPRLELVACEIGSRLAVHIKSMMEFEDIPITLWTDSTTALACIKRDMNWSVFVAGRVKKIRQNSSITDWRHVPGKENPADIPSRGASISQLITTRWTEWSGTLQTLETITLDKKVEIRSTPIKEDAGREGDSHRPESSHAACQSQPRLAPTGRFQGSHPHGRHGHQEHRRQQ